MYVKKYTRFYSEYSKIIYTIKISYFMTSDLKFNINKIDSDLKNLFEGVYITEKFEKGQYYVQINTNSVFVNENKGYKSRIEVVVDIPKTELSKNVINWKYYTNPSNIATSHVIERVSNIEQIATDIFDIARNRRMDSKYFESLDQICELINENNTEIKEISVLEKIKKSLGDLEFNFYDIKEERQILVENNEFMIKKPDVAFLISHNNILDYGDKFNLEKTLLGIDGINSVSFKDRCLKIDFTPNN